MRRPIVPTTVKVAIAAVMVSAAVGGVIWLRPDRLEGRPIAFWLRAVQEGKDLRAIEVLTHAGSEWVPQLCRYAAGQPGFLERSASTLFSGRVAWLNSWLDRRWNQRMCVSQAALQALAGNSAWTNHVPEVLHASSQGAAFLDDGAKYFGVFSSRVGGRSRVSVTPEVVNALTEAAANRSPWIQYYSICALGRIGPSASNAVPVIKDRLRARGRTVAQHAAHALWRISGERREPLRVLVSGLDSPERDVLQWTRQYLVAIAPEATELPPQLLELREENERLTDLSPPGSRRADIPAGPVLLAVLHGLAKSSDEDLAAAATAALADLGTRR